MANDHNLIPAKKGEVRNPNGRPKGVPNSKTRLLRLLEITQDLKNPITGEVEGFSVAEQLDLQQIIKARKGDTKAYSVLMDRLEGKPAQSIDMTSNGETLFNTTKMTIEVVDAHTEAEPQTEDSP